MNTKKKNSAALKSLARESLIGRYGVMAGGGALIIAMNILSTFIPEWIFPGYTVFSQIGQFLISIVISLLVSLFSAGYTRLALDVSRGRRPLLGDMLHPFFHHPDRFLLTYLILVVIQVILQIPVTIASRMYANAFLQQTLTLEFPYDARTERPLFLCDDQFLWRNGSQRSDLRNRNAVGNALYGDHPGIFLPRSGRRSMTRLQNPCTGRRFSPRAAAHGTHFLSVQGFFCFSSEPLQKMSHFVELIFLLC